MGPQIPWWRTNTPSDRAYLEREGEGRGREGRGGGERDAEKEKSDPLKCRGLLTFLGGVWMNRVQVSTQ